MGLIKASIEAVKGTLADQWKEFFYCDAIDPDILVVKGQKRTGRRSSNTKGSDNIISSGSGIAVADGQCMIIVEQGKVVEVCAEPGQFTYDASTEPSIFSGHLGESIVETFSAIGRRIAHGGDTGKDQRVYYFNLKEIIDNKFGTPNPIPFRVVDHKVGLDVDVSVRCNGVYSYRLANPLLFYANVCGNVEYAYSRSEIDSQLKAELISHLGPAFANISNLEVRPNQIPAKNLEICQALKQELTAIWTQNRGIEIVSVAFNSVTIPKEDEDMIKQTQRTAVMRDPGMAAATLVEAQAQAMKSAAANKNGAMMGFMGMDMASKAGGMDAQSLFRMSAEQSARTPAAPSAPAPKADLWRCSCGVENSGKFCVECGKARPQTQQGWKCQCGAVNEGKFCTECGSPRPEQEGWKCSCGTLNKGKFCVECGKPRPAGAPVYGCDKCGWNPPDPHHPPKFCPECGDVFNEEDQQ